ncbi:histidine phosphatase family protein [Candidatus Parcubacteria bacterium]|nr:histidine phosphatase family protein [Candidatus Parcubacteria bacterium]
MPYFKNKVFFVRHGETEWNLEKRTQGSHDSPLTERGILQAIETAKSLKNHKFGMIVCSPLGRVLQTSNIIAKELRISNLTISPYIAERNFGVLEGRKKEESLKLFPQYWDKEGHFIHTSKVENGESLEEFLERIKQGVEEIRSFSETKNILVVTHDHALHAIVGNIKNIPFGEVQKSYKFNHGEPINLG